MIKLGIVYYSTIAAILTLGMNPALAQVVENDLDATASNLAEAGFSAEPIAPNLNLFPTISQWETAQTTETPTATNFLISPRIGGQLTTGPGVGYGSSFGSIYSFIPIAQTPGSNLAFAETRLNISTDKGRLGGNVVLGYRNYFPEPNFVFGGYLAYDIRQTGNSTFNQIGAGLELLGNPWEVRLNSYFPVGETRNLIAESLSAQSIAFSNPRFVGNFLQLTQQTSTRRDRLFEGALTGFDLEAGTRLIAWDGGDLRGYVGTYVYGGAGVSTFAGFRTRLAARPTPNFNVGLSLQSDREFGTNLVLSFGANWGGSRPRGNSQPETVIARLADSVARQENIAVAQRWQTDVLLSQSEVNATNPATGQPWFFRHVNLTGTAGNGTFGSPFNSVTTALNGIPSDGNQIVYVQETGTTQGFTIPASVRVLSSGPIQQLNTQEGSTQLPGSGSGNIPTINGTVTLQPNSVLNGFNIVVPNPAPTNPNQPQPQPVPVVPIILDGKEGSFSVQNVTATVSAANTPAISCSDVTGTVNLDLSGSNLTVTNGNGIRCTNVTGTVTINAPAKNAQITVNSGQAGVFFQNNPGTVNLANLNITSNGGAALEATNVGNVSIADSTFASNNAPGNGITLNGVTGTFGVTNTGVTINNPTGNGINASNVSGTVNFTANAGSTITTNTANAGISLTNSTGTVNFSNFGINSTGGAALEANTIANASFTNSTLSSTNSGTNGITLNGVTGTFGLTNTGVTIATPTGNGINASNVSGTANLNATAGSTVTTNNANAGISLSNSTGKINVANLGVNSTGGAALEANTIANASFTNSTLSSTNSGTNGITLNGVTGTFGLTNTGVTIATPTGNGIDVTNITGIANLTANAGSQITNTTGFGAQLQNSTGTIAMSGFNITDSGNSGVRGSNVSNVTLQNNTITRATNQGVRLENSNGTFTVANNTIQDTQGFLPAAPSLTNPPTGQGMLLTEVTGTVDIRSNQITGTTGFDGNIDPANLNNTYTPSGQGIVVANTTGNINLTIEGNTAANKDQVISGNREDAILIGLGDDPRNATPAIAATANVTIQNNTIQNNGSTAPVRGDAVGLILEQNARIDNLTISDNSMTGNGDDGIDVRLGAVSIALIAGGQSFASTAQVNNATISNNTITLPTGSAQEGINVELYQATRFQASITNNTLTNGSAGLQVRNYINIGNSTTTPISLDATALASGRPVACIDPQGNTSTNNFVLQNTPPIPAAITGTLPPALVAAVTLIYNANVDNTTFQVVPDLASISGNNNSVTVNSNGTISAIANIGACSP